jgi:hypothetical protein
MSAGTVHPAHGRMMQPEEFEEWALRLNALVDELDGLSIAALADGLMFHGLQRTALTMSHEKAAQMAHGLVGKMIGHYQFHVAAAEQENRAKVAAYRNKMN